MTGTPPARPPARTRPRAGRLRAAARVGGLALALSAAVVLAGPADRLGSAVFVSVDGIPVAVAPGTTLGRLTAERAVAPASGAHVDVAGDVILPGSGLPGAVEVAGAVAPSGLVLLPGASVTTRRGADRPEPLIRATQPIPHQSVSEGSGPVVALVRKGVDGERELFRGESTKRTAASFVTAEPVTAVLRHSASLATGQKAAALTFDDGPSTYTEQILAVLAEKEVSATFFWIGSVAAGKGETVRRVRAGGHEVENHTWSHPDLVKLSPRSVATEIARAAQALGGTGFLRPPYGSYDNAVAEQAGLQGHRLALWDVDTLDWKTRDAAAITARVKAGVRPGAIILMHDGGGDRSQTVAALPGVIDWLLEEGYALTTLQKLVGGG